MTEDFETVIFFHAYSDYLNHVINKISAVRVCVFQLEKKIGQIWNGEVV
jgi:hypothetical protein